MDRPSRSLSGGVLALVCLVAAGCDRGFLRDIPRPLPATDAGGCTVRVPVNVVATATGESTVEVEWSSLDRGVEIFIVQRDDGSDFADYLDPLDGETFLFTDPNALRDTVYRYRVRATAPTCTTEHSAPASVTTWPLPVADPTAVGQAGGGIALSWTDPNDAQQPTYRIERREVGTPSFTLVTTEPFGTAAYLDGTALPETEYEYSITTIGPAGGTGVVTTTEWTFPRPPGNVGVLGASATSISVTWTDPNMNETAYLVYRSSDGFTFDGGTSLPAGSTQFVDDASSATPPQTGALYWYRVCSLRGSDESCAADVSGTTTLNPSPAVYQSPELEMSCDFQASGDFGLDTAATLQSSTVDPGEPPSGCSALTETTNVLDDLTLRFAPPSPPIDCSYAVDWQIADGLGGATATRLNMDFTPAFLVALTRPAGPPTSTFPGFDPWAGCQGCGGTRPPLLEAGLNHTCVNAGADASDHRQLCFGINDLGQIGASPSEPFANPEIICSAAEDCAGRGPFDAIDLSAGRDHNCLVVGASGDVVCWGDNASGQTGRGPANASSTEEAAPVCTAGSMDVNLACAGGYLTGAVRVAAGGAHTCAVMSDSSVKCWGSDAYGQLGRGTGATGEQALPGYVCDYPDAFDGSACGTGDPLGNIADITAGESHTCALSASTYQRVVCWGDNSAGQLGRGPGATVADEFPGAVCAAGTLESPYLCGNGNWLFHVVAFDAGAMHTCALRSSGALYCWGSNTSGQLGNGLSGSVFPTPQGVCITGSWDEGSSACSGGTELDAVVAVSAGGAHTCALREDGRVWCWGDNSDGQLGRGAGAGNEVHAGGVCRSGAWDGSGCGAGGELLDEVVAISAGGQHTCALRAGGRLYCWGANSYGQTGGGTTGGSFAGPQIVCETTERASSEDCTAPGQHFSDADRIECRAYSVTIQ